MKNSKNYQLSTINYQLFCTFAPSNQGITFKSIKYETIITY